MWYDTFNWWSIAVFLWVWPLFAVYFIAKEIRGLKKKK